MKTAAATEVSAPRRGTEESDRGTPGRRKVEREKSGALLGYKLISFRL